jgi:ABC-2 type transport system ATP-binding protein
MTAREYFAFLSRMRRVDCRGTVDTLCERMSLDQGMRIGEMSKGTRQKVGVVHAFMHSLMVVVLDEPTSGLDPLVQHEFDRDLGEACTRGTAVLLSSHVLGGVERLADRVAILDSGRLVAFDAWESPGTIPVWAFKPSWRRFWRPKPQHHAIGPVLPSRSV